MLLPQALIKPFCERNAITRAGSIIWHWGARGPAMRSDGTTFFGLHLYLAGRCCDNSQSTRGPVQYKFGSGMTWLVCVTIFCSIFQ